MVPRVILVAGAVATATAAGFITANSPAATQACRLTSVAKPHGQVSMTFHESATGVTPDTKHSITVSLSREATIGVHLTKLRANPTYASDEETGTGLS